MMNPIRPDHLTTAAYLAEVADILAAGFLRLRARHTMARQSTSFARAQSESSLGCAADQSGHVNRENLLDQHLGAGAQHD